MKENFSLQLILDNSCGNPEDFEAYQAYLSDLTMWMRATTDDQRGVKPTYTGVMLHVITLHCLVYRVRAQADLSGTWTVLDYFLEDH